MLFYCETNLTYGIMLKVGDRMKFKHLNYDGYEEYMKYYQLSSLAAKVLATMNLSDEKIKELLFHQMNINEFDLSFLDETVYMLQHAKLHKEKIIVCGDYDCDGICATTIIVDALRKFGIECGYYIPNRFSEGYGINKNTVALAKEKGYQIILTVDNGVKAKDVLSQAKAAGLKIILSDHHVYEEDEVIYDCFLHPNVFPDFFHGMCGAGIAYLLSRRLIGEYDKHTMLAAVATIGDVVPLQNANRVIVKEGIRLLNTKNYLALQMLQNDNKKWDASKIAFQVVPKINCIGRMADLANANRMVQYLLLENDAAIQNTIVSINQLNEKRKQISEKMEEKAKHMAKQERSDFYLLYDSSFHEGLNGIVASKIMHEFHCPAMVLSERNSLLKGSIRSNTVDLSTFFDEIKPLLITYGGHKEAAGICFEKKHLQEIQSFIHEKMKSEKKEEEISVLPITKEELTYAEVSSLSILEPFGCDFELPLFCVHDDHLTISALSNGKHLKYSGSHLNYLYFNQGNRYQNDVKRTDFTFIGKVEANNFYGKKSVNLIVDYLIDPIYNK